MKKSIKKMGYAHDQKGILKRYFREQENGESHMAYYHNKAVFFEVIAMEL